MAKYARKAGTNSSKKESERMEFNEDQLAALQVFIEREVSNQMLMDKYHNLKKSIEQSIEKDGWRLSSRLEKLVHTNDAFLIEKPEPEPDYGHVDDPEQVM